MYERYLRLLGQDLRGIRMEIPFTKLHGNGNDFVMIDEHEKIIIPDDMKGQFAAIYCDRRFGIGADGVIYLSKSEKSTLRMRILQPDKSEAEMCGNGIRCLAKYVYDNVMAAKDEIKVETLAGIKILKLFIRHGKVHKVRVNMGKPSLMRPQIPMKGPKGKVISEPLEAGGNQYLITCVSMGNPHTVIYVENVSRFPVEKVGPVIENLPLFPKRTNVEFVQVLSAQEVKMRTWERGAGETLACGTGACAVCVAGVLNKKTARSITAHLSGGDLELEWRQSDASVYMTGPAATVFTGEWKQD